MCEGAESAMVATFCSYDFFFEAIIVTSAKSFGHLCEGAESAMVATFCSYDFFFEAIIVTSAKSFSHSPV